MEKIQEHVHTILDVGGNKGIRAHKAYPNAKIRVVDVKFGWDIMKKGLPEGLWDIILVNHMIEHLWDPDELIRMCKEVMRPDTVLEISTPNLCAWFNRVLFLFGWLPHSYEVSYEYNVGKPFGWNNERIGGHLRVFSVNALKSLLEKHELKILEVKGEASTYDCHKIIRLVDKWLTICPSLASAIRIKCMKK